MTRFSIHRAAYHDARPAIAMVVEDDAAGGAEGPAVAAQHALAGVELPGTPPGGRQPLGVMAMNVRGEGAHLMPYCGCDGQFCMGGRAYVARNAS